MIRHVQVVDNQRACCRDGLKSNVAVVEIGPCHADGDVDLVVEEVSGWDGPLGGNWGAVAKGGDCHREAMPVLWNSGQLLLKMSLSEHIPW